jgi:copper chaperone
MLTLNLPSMHCGGCVRSVTAVLHTLDPQAQVEMDLPTKTVRVETAITTEAIVHALTQAGHPPQASGS